MSNIEVPAHVPPELVRDFNYLDSSSETDVYRFFSKLHDGPDIFYTPRNYGHWVATRFEDMEYILDRTTEFCSETHTIPKEAKLAPVPLVEMDGQLHRDFRKLLQPFFLPKAVQDLHIRAREFTNTLIDGFYASGECDFTKDFALKMPVGIMMGVMGLPASDTAYLLKLADELIRGSPDARRAAFGSVYAYIGDTVIPLRRAQPGNDLFSALLAGTVADGRLLSEQEIKGMGVLLVAAGLDTVANMLCFITRFLAENPAHRMQLLNTPELINDALEELMRRHHVVNIARVAVHDMNYKGIVIKAGDPILIPTTLAGIDEKRFKDALTVDFSRTDKKALVFGRGPHLCVGALLGRTELRVFLAEWLKRIPHFDIRPGTEIVSITGRVNSIPSLPLVWEVA